MQIFHHPSLHAAARRAIEAAYQAPPNEKRYRVGAVLMDDRFDILSTGFTGETGETDHAEEAALKKSDQGSKPKSILTTMEPCSKRDSKPLPCIDLIASHGIKTVYTLQKEPRVFVPQSLTQTKSKHHDIDLVYLSGYGQALEQLHTHLNMAATEKPDPIIMLSFAMTADGYLDDDGPNPLQISTPEDLEDMRHLRSYFDAIMVGANTIRKDNPRLLLTDTGDIQARIARGQQRHLTKITMTISGNLNPQSQFFQTGGQTDVKRIVMAPQKIKHAVEEKLHNTNTHVAEFQNEKLKIQEFYEVCKTNNIHSVFVEGGANILTQFLTSKAYDHKRIFISDHTIGPQKYAPRINKSLLD